MQQIIIKSTIDDLNQYLNGNVTKSSLIETLKTATEYLQSEYEVKQIK